MTNRLVVVLGLSVFASTHPLSAAEGVYEKGPRQSFEVTNTERVPFSPGGTIRISNSYGYLTVEGWDEAAVEIIVIKSTDSFYEPSHERRAEQPFDQVRVVARSILRRNGYQVIDARHAGEALLHSEKHGGTIDLLLSDVVMPQMSGPELARRLSTVRPEMRVLCMSGYTDDSIVRHGVLEAHLAYIQKPITPVTLATKVREVLDGGKRNAQ